MASAARARDAKRPVRSAEDAAQQAARPKAATTGSPLEGADGQAEGAVPRSRPPDAEPPGRRHNFVMSSGARAGERA